MKMFILTFAQESVPLLRDPRLGFLFLVLLVIGAGYWLYEKWEEARTQKAKEELSLFLLALGYAVQSGEAILEAIELSGALPGTERIRTLANFLVEKIREGEPISTPMLDHLRRHFCHLLSEEDIQVIVNLTDVGEETGAMDRMLKKAAYDLAPDKTKLLPSLYQALGLISADLPIALYLELGADEKAESAVTSADVSRLAETIIKFAQMDFCQSDREAIETFFAKEFRAIRDIHEKSLLLRMLNNSAYGNEKGGTKRLLRSMFPRIETSALFAEQGCAKKRNKNFLVRFSILQDAGLPVLRSLRLLKHQGDEVDSIIEEIESGCTLFEAAMKVENSPLSSWELRLALRIGEAYGSLETVLAFMSGEPLHKKSS